MASNPRQITWADLFFFFHGPKSFNKQFDYIFPCVYCNKSQKTSQRVKNNNHSTSFRVVLFCSLHTVMLYLSDLWSITVHTHRKCNILVKYWLNGLIALQKCYERWRKFAKVGHFVFLVAVKLPRKEMSEFWFCYSYRPLYLHYLTFSNVYVTWTYVSHLDAWTKPQNQCY